MTNRGRASLWMAVLLAAVGLALLFVFETRSVREEPAPKAVDGGVLPPDVSRVVRSDAAVLSSNLANGAGAVSDRGVVAIPGGGVSTERRVGDSAHATAGGTAVIPDLPTIVPVPAAPSALVAEYRGEPNAILRREAMVKWNQENQPGVGEVVQIAVADADPSVILQALEILGRRGDKASAPLLARVIRENGIRADGYGMPIREMAIRALGICGGGANVPQLVAELDRHEDLSYDNVVVEAMGLIGDVSALDALNRQIRRLEQFKPGERMVQEVVQRALEITIAARDRITKRGE